jgi:hypothetical protein
MAWWHEVVLPSAAQLRFIQGRVAFEPPRGRALSAYGNRPVYASVVVVFSPEHAPGRPAALSTLVAPRNGKGKTWGTTTTLNRQEEPR